MSLCHLITLFSGIVVWDHWSHPHLSSWCLQQRWRCRWLWFISVCNNEPCFCCRLNMHTVMWLHSKLCWYQFCDLFVYGVRWKIILLCHITCALSSQLCLSCFLIFVGFPIQGIITTVNDTHPHVTSLVRHGVGCKVWILALNLKMLSTWKDNRSAASKMREDREDFSLLGQDAKRILWKVLPEELM